MMGIVALSGIVVNDSLILIVSIDKHVKPGYRQSMQQSQGAYED